MSWGPRVVAQQVTQLLGEQTRLLALEKAVGGYQQGRARFGVEWRHIVCRAADPAEVAVLLLAAVMVPAYRLTGCSGDSQQVLRAWPGGPDQVRDQAQVDEVLPRRRR